MGLFDAKNAAPTSVVPPAVAECDSKLAVIAKRREEVVHAIGQLYVENNDLQSAAGTPYEPHMKEIEDMETQKAELEKRRLAVQGLRKCEKCGNILVLDSAFCNKCGEKLEELVIAAEQNANICSKCGSTYAEGAAFCTNCGNKLN